MAMERSTFLRTLPFLFPISLDYESPTDNTSLPIVIIQHRKIILEEIARLKYTEEADIDDESTTAASSTGKMAGSEVQSIGTIISNNHVVSIEPTDMNTGEQSNSPAFFIPSKQRSGPLNHDSKADDNESDDPSLSSFQAFLLPATLPLDNPRRGCIMGYTTPSNRSSTSKYPFTTSSSHKYSARQNKSQSPTVSSVSTSLSKSQSTPHQFAHHGSYFNPIGDRDSSMEECLETGILYLLFEGKYLFCADPCHVRHITVYPGETLTTSQQKQVVISKPPCLVISFDMCSFRVFDGSFLLQSSSSTFSPPSEELYPARERLRQEEDRLQSMLNHLQSYITHDRQLYTEHQNAMGMVIPETFGLRLCKMTAPASLLNAAAAAQEQHSDGIHHENGQNEDAMRYPTETMGKLLLEGSNTSSVSTHGDKCHDGMKQKDIENSSGSFTSLDKLNEEHSRVERGCMLKQKQDSYVTSWSALMNLKKALTEAPGTDALTRSQHLSQLAKLSVDRLEQTYCDNLISTEEIENMNKYNESMKQLEDVNNIQRELDLTMESIFPVAPKNRPTKVGRRSLEHRIIAVQTDNPTIDEMMKLQTKVEESLTLQRDAIFKRHMIAFLPSK